MSRSAANTELENRSNKETGIKKRKGKDRAKNGLTDFRLAMEQWSNEHYCVHQFDI